MNNGETEVTLRKCWHILMIGLFVAGLLVLLLEIFKFRVSPNISLWLMGGAIFGGLMSLLQSWLATPKKVEIGQSVSQRTKVSLGEQVYETKPGHNRSDPETGTNFWTLPAEPAIVGTASGQSVAAQRPSAFAGFASWLTTNDKIGVIMLYLGALAAFIFGTFFSVKAAEADLMLGYVTGAVLCFALSGALITAAVGKGGAALEWIGKHLAFVGFMLSLIAMFYFGRYAYEGAFIWHWNNWEWPHVGFLLSAILMFLLGLCLVGKLGWFMEGLGKGLAYLHFGGLSYTLSLIVWLGWLIGGSLVVALVTKSPVFDRLLYTDVAGEAFAIGNMAITFGVGFFLIVGAIALDYFRFKK